VDESDHELDKSNCQGFLEEKSNFLFFCARHNLCGIGF